MLRVILTWIVILNLSSTPLHDAMLVVGDDAIELGCIDCDESRRIEIESTDSVRVVFRLGNEWLATDLFPARHMIKIDDNTETFDVEVEFSE